MYLMFADEADQDATKKSFLVYGAIYVPTNQAYELCKKIGSQRKKYGFSETDTLKFSTGTIPESVTRDDHAALKSSVLSIAAEHEVSAACYVVFHDVAKNQDKETKLKWAINTLCVNFDRFLKRKNESGIAFFDRTTDFKQENYFKEIMAEGTPKYDGDRIPIRRVLGINSTQSGLSHLNSLCDIVVGSMRFVFNEPDKDVVGKLLFGQLANLLWGSKSSDGKTWYVLNQGIIFRPKEISVEAYRADREATLSMLKKYAFEK